MVTQIIEFIFHCLHVIVPLTMKAVAPKQHTIVVHAKKYIVQDIKTLKNVLPEIAIDVSIIFPL